MKIAPLPDDRPEPQFIDLAVPHPEGGYDPEARITGLGPGLSVVRSPLAAGASCHVAGSVLDPAAVIMTDGVVIPPQAASFIDAECADCDSALAVLPNQEPNVNWFVVEHSPTCPALAAWKGPQP